MNFYRVLTSTPLLKLCMHQALTVIKGDAKQSVLRNLNSVWCVFNEHLAVLNARSGVHTEEIVATQCILSHAVLVNMSHYKLLIYSCH